MPWTLAGLLITDHPPPPPHTHCSLFHRLYSRRCFVCSPSPRGKLGGRVRDKKGRLLRNRKFQNAEMNLFFFFSPIDDSKELQRPGRQCAAPSSSYYTYSKSCSGRAVCSPQQFILYALKELQWPGCVQPPAVHSIHSQRVAGSGRDASGQSPAPSSSYYTLLKELQWPGCVQPPAVHSIHSQRAAGSGRDASGQSPAPSSSYYTLSKSCSGRAVCSPQQFILYTLKELQRPGRQCAAPSSSYYTLSKSCSSRDASMQPPAVHTIHYSKSCSGRAVCSPQQFILYALKELQWLGCVQPPAVHSIHSQRAAGSGWDASVQPPAPSSSYYTLSKSCSGRAVCSPQQFILYTLKELQRPGHQCAAPSSSYYTLSKSCSGRAVCSPQQFILYALKELQRPGRQCAAPSSSYYTLSKSCSGRAVCSPQQFILYALKELQAAAGTPVCSPQQSILYALSLCIRTITFYMLGN